MIYFIKYFTIVIVKILVSKDILPTSNRHISMTKIWGEKNLWMSILFIYKICMNLQQEQGWNFTCGWFCSLHYIPYVFLCFMGALLPSLQLN